MSTFDVPDENNHKRFKVRVTQEVEIEVDLRTLVSALPEVARAAAKDTVQQELARGMGLHGLADAYNASLQGVVARIIPRPLMDKFLDMSVEVIEEAEDGG